MIEVKTANTIKLFSEDLGLALAESDSFEQAQFLDVVAEKTKEYSWCMQCSRIVEDIRDKDAVMTMLEVLLGHIRDS